MKHSSSKEARYVTPNGTLRGAHEIVQPGDQYQWNWRQPFTVEGEITDVKLNEEISFTFGVMQVSVHFTQLGEQTEVHLIQTDIPDTADGLVFDHLNCRSCWVFFFTNLSSIFETNRDLRDANPDRVSSMEVGFFPLSKQKN
ncbi:MAG: SRPBCC domain-containing protein [Caldilineaceae bacterium]|nr:SRPBCC domain-containing protein [Caldilineaceae bacterium]